MFDPRTLDQLAQALAARIIPQIKNGHGAGNRNSERKLLTVEEAAIYLGRYTVTRDGEKIPSCSAIYHLVARREIPVVRHGRALRFDIKSLDEWVARDKS